MYEATSMRFQYSGKRHNLKDISFTHEWMDKQTSGRKFGQLGRAAELPLHDHYYLLRLLLLKSAGKYCCLEVSGEIYSALQV